MEWKMTLAILMMIILQKQNFSALENMISRKESDISWKIQLIEVTAELCHRITLRSINNCGTILFPRRFLFLIYNLRSLSNSSSWSRSFTHSIIAEVLQDFLKKNNSKKLILCGIFSKLFFFLNSEQEIIEISCLHSTKIMLKLRKSTQYQVSEKIE